jgi:hypothetical protein
VNIGHSLDEREPAFTKYNFYLRFRGFRIFQKVMPERSNRNDLPLRRRSFLCVRQNVRERFGKSR